MSSHEDIGNDKKLAFAAWHLFMEFLRKNRRESPRVILSMCSLDGTHREVPELV